MGIGHGIRSAFAFRIGLPAGIALVKMGARTG
jgi:hypothetical protein